MEKIKLTKKQINQNLKSFKFKQYIGIDLVWKTIARLDIQNINYYLETHESLKRFYNKKELTEIIWNKLNKCIK